MSAHVRVTWRGDAYKKQIHRAVRAGLADFGKEVVKVATPMVPVDTGTLRRSAAVSVGGDVNHSSIFQSARAGTDFSKMALSMSAKITLFISYNTPYAVFLHETPDIRHSSTGWRPRANSEACWKWLEKAFNATSSRYAPFIKKHTSRIKLRV